VRSVEYEPFADLEHGGQEVEVLAEGEDELLGMDTSALEDLLVATQTKKGVPDRHLYIIMVELNR